jgi:uncharacterized protein YjiK
LKILILLALSLVLLSNCSLSETQPTGVFLSLILIDSFDLEILEPSDLCYDSSTNSLWTVSDNTNLIYNIDFEGNILQTLPYTGEDLEGISYDHASNTLWIVEEFASDAVNVSVSGEELARFDLPIEPGTNSGAEGIFFSDDNNICVVKEKDPGVFYSFDSSFNLNEEITLDFAEDYAAITYDYSKAGFWIVSDQNQSIYLWDQQNGVREEYSLPFQKPEGIVFIAETDFFYLVSDSEQKLYKMQLRTD